jgi:hypothetical protein
MNGCPTPSLNPTKEGKAAGRSATLSFISRWLFIDGMCIYASKMNGRETLRITIPK